MSCGGLYGWVRAAPVAFEKRTLRCAGIPRFEPSPLQYSESLYSATIRTEESMQEQLKTIDAQYFQRLNCRPLPIYPLLSNSI